MTVYKESAPALRPPVNEFGERVRAHTRYCICRSCGGTFAIIEGGIVCPHCGTLKDADLVPGATTVAEQLGWSKTPLKIWANRKGLEGIDSQKYADAAADAGSAAHYIIQCEETGVEPILSGFSPEDLELAGYAVEQFHQWKRRLALRPVLVERPLVSKKWRYGGTVDFLVYLDGELTLVDWKTSTAIYPEHFVQVSGYCALLIEHGYRIAGARVVRVPRRELEDFEEHTLSGEQVKVYFAIFRHLLGIYYLERDLKEINRGQRNRVRTASRDGS